MDPSKFPPEMLEEAVKFWFSSHVNKPAQEPASASAAGGVPDPEPVKTEESKSKDEPIRTSSGDIRIVKSSSDSKEAHLEGSAMNPGDESKGSRKRDDAANMEPKSEDKRKEEKSEGGKKKSSSSSRSQSRKDSSKSSSRSQKEHSEDHAARGSDRKSDSSQGQVRSGDKGRGEEAACIQREIVELQMKDEEAIRTAKSVTESTAFREKKEAEARARGNPGRSESLVASKDVSERPGNQMASEPKSSPKGDKRDSFVGDDMDLSLDGKMSPVCRPSRALAQPCKKHWPA